MSNDATDKELAELLQALPPEELADMDDESLDILLAAQVRTSAREAGYEDERLSDLLAGPDEDAREVPTFSTPAGFEEPEPELEPELEPGLEPESFDEGASGLSNPAVAETVGEATAVDYDEVDNYPYEEPNTEPEPEPEPAPFMPPRPQHPEPDFENNGLEEELSNAQGTADPFSDKVDIEEEKPGLKQRLANIPFAAKAGIAALLIASVVGGILLVGGEEKAVTPVDKGVADDNSGSAAVADNGAAILPGDGDTDQDTAETTPVLLTDYISTVSGKCLDDPKAKQLGPPKAFSTIDTDAWVCYRAMGIDGAVMNIVFREPVTLTEIRFVPGFNYVQPQSGEDKWVQHRVISRVLWRAGGQQFVQEVQPQRAEVSYVFEEPVTTDSMSMTIQKSEIPEGANLGDNTPSDVFTNEKPPEIQVGVLQDATAVQKIQLFGYPAGVAK